MDELQRRLRIYHYTAIFSMLFALVGFSYNAWRLEVSEDNSTLRLAAFQVLTELSKLQQIVYASHYDHNEVEGSPRKGWVKVGLINDLSILLDDKVREEAALLGDVWQNHWASVADDKKSVDAVIDQLDNTRNSVKLLLRELN